MGQGPLGLPKLPSVAIVSFWRFTTCREEAFFSKLLCLARISRNVTKMGQHGSGSPRAPKTALGCKSLILAIHDRSRPVEQRPFFQSCSV